MGGAVAYVNLVARAELARGNDAKVGAGTTGAREQPDHLRVAEPQAELEARLPRLADLELDGPDRPALADHGAGDVDAREREVLAEGAGLERAAEPSGPPGGVLGCVGVDGLVGTAVDAPVGLVVAVDVDAGDPDTMVDRRLPDRAHHRPPVPDADLPGATDVDGQESHVPDDMSRTLGGW
jgi:hypothetical protein